MALATCVGVLGAMTLLTMIGMFMVDRNDHRKKCKCGDKTRSEK